MNTEIKKKDFSGKNLFFILLFSLLHTAAMFLMTSAPLKTVAETIRQNPFLLFLNGIVIFLTGMILYGLIGRVKIAVFLNGLFYLLLFLVNRTKILYRNDPLKISDFRQGMEAIHMNIKGGYTPDLRGIFIVLLFVLLTAIFLHVLQFHRISLRGRLLHSILGILLFAALYVGVYPSDELYESLPLVGNAYNDVDQYNSKGFNYTFLFQSKFSKIEKPENYDLKRYKELEAQGEDIPFEVAKKPPHIIWIMGEAFTDLSQDSVFQFSTKNDPNYNFKRLKEKAILSGYIVTPSFAGGTGDTEFDVLTGTMTMHMAPDSTYSFASLKRPTRSLVTALKEIGYKSYAFHPGHEWFYHRNVAYPNLGFEESMFLEDIEHPINKGDYLSQEQFTDLFIEGFKEKIAQGTPIFDYAVDIQNHGPYFYDKYGETLPFTSTVELSDKAREVLGSYFIGVKDMDIMLGRIDQLMEERDEPILFVFYGDHLPGLGDSPSAFEEAGIDIGWDNYEEELRYYSTPYIILGNEKGRQCVDSQRIEIQKGDYISANYLAGVFLDLLDYTEADPFFQYNSRLRKQLPVISRHYLSDGDQSLLLDHMTEEQRELYNDYRGYEYYRIVDQKIEK